MMKLIVGLGNPEDKYASTRHNLGFRVMDELADRIKNQESSWEYKRKLKSEIMGLSLIHNSNSLILILAKPQTYMNNSGLAVSALVQYFKIQPQDIIIVYDELDLPLGKIKVRQGGAAAGHHGVESVIKSLGTDQFIRVRLGIGPSVGPAEKFVLENFKPTEKPQVKHMVKQALKALDLLLDQDLEAAQNQFN